MILITGKNEHKIIDAVAIRLGPNGHLRNVHKEDMSNYLKVVLKDSCDDAAEEFSMYIWPSPWIWNRIY